MAKELAKKPEYKLALNVSKENRTPRQERLVNEVGWNMRKEGNRRRNRRIFHGRRPTTTGVMFFNRAAGIRR